MAVSKRLSIVKFLELAIACICVGLHHESMGGNNAQVELLISGTFVGFIIIFIGEFAGHIMQTPINKRIDMFFSLVGVGMFIASGALIIDTWHNSYSGRPKDLQLSKASMAIINGGLLLLDAVLTHLGG